MHNETSHMPMVTVLLPTYQSEKYLQEALDSIWAQTFHDFEVLIVNDDNSAAMSCILQKNACSRLRVIDGRNRGLADALNIGIEEARGKYIARFDADDVMLPKRLEKQVAYMEKNSNVAVCGGWQQYFGLSTFLHAPSENREQCKANLLFCCDLCHSTLMLRRSFFIQHDLRYDPKYAAEDFELWTRVLNYGDIANLPEVLGLYRETGTSITDSKKKRLISENGKIVANTLHRNLGLDLTEEQREYFAGWINPFYSRNTVYQGTKRTEAWRDLRQLMEDILSANEKEHFYDANALQQAVRSEWLALRYNLSFQATKHMRSPDTFEKLRTWQIFFRKTKSFFQNYQGIERKINKLKKTIKK